MTKWTEYVVCDGQGNVSWDAKTEAPQRFKQFRGPKGAEARAKELAESEPGSVVRIYELTAEVVAAVEAPETIRREPTEHYK